MWLTADVQVNRATKLTEAEKGVLSKCALCGQCAAGRRNEHLLFKCTDARVVEVRKEVEAAVERKVGRLMKPGPVKEATMVPWRLDSDRTVKGDRITLRWWSRWRQLLAQCWEQQHRLKDT